jgi:hypothetical protein
MTHAGVQAKGLNRNLRHAGSTSGASSCVAGDGVRRIMVRDSKNCPNCGKAFPGISSVAKTCPLPFKTSKYSRSVEHVPGTRRDMIVPVKSPNPLYLLLSMPHLWPGGVVSLGDKREANGRPTVRAFGSNGRLIEDFILALCEPYELRALWAATDLRCHDVPRTLLVMNCCDWEII